MALMSFAKVTRESEASSNLLKEGILKGRLIGQYLSLSAPWKKLPKGSHFYEAEKHCFIVGIFCT